MSQLPEPYGPTSHRYRSKRLSLHYVDWGNRGAPPLLLVHGGRDHCRNWDWVAADLRRDYHIIAPDLRGHGDSDWSQDGDYSAQSMVYDVAQLLHQQGLGPVNLIAHSFGGIVSLRLAGLYPELFRRMIVIEGLGFDWELNELPPIEERLATWVGELRAVSGRLPRRYRSIAEACARMKEANAHLSDAQAEHLTVHGVMRNEDGTYGWKFDNYVWLRPPSDLRRHEVHRLWSRIECPVLHVHGRESWVKHPEQGGLLDHFRDATVADLEGSGHWVHHDRLDDFLGLARRFLGAPARS